MINLRKIPHWKKVGATEVNTLIDRINTLSKITATGGLRVTTGPTGIHLTNLERIDRVKSKVFEVQSAATGDGVYNCYEQILDATEWNDVAGDDKFNNKNTISIEVLNLLENDPEATYKECLATGDRIKAWKLTDDEGNLRWMGIPISGGFIRMARTTEAAPAAANITCNLIGNDGSEITSGLGSAIEVYCKISGGGNLNDAVPRLADDDYMFVANLQGKWWCTTIFQASEDCDCYSAS